MDNMPNTQIQQYTLFSNAALAAASYSSAVDILDYSSSQNPVITLNVPAVDAGSATALHLEGRPDPKFNWTHLGVMTVSTTLAKTQDFTTKMYRQLRLHNHNVKAIDGLTVTVTL